MKKFVITILNLLILLHLQITQAMQRPYNPQTDSYAYEIFGIIPKDIFTYNIKAGRHEFKTPEDKEKFLITYHNLISLYNPNNFLKNKKAVKLAQEITADIDEAANFISYPNINEGRHFRAIFYNYKELLKELENEEPDLLKELKNKHPSEYNPETDSYAYEIFGLTPQDFIENRITLEYELKSEAKKNFIKAFHTLSRQIHPDKLTSDVRPLGSDLIKEINSAKDFILNPNSNINPPANYMTIFKEFKSKMKAFKEMNAIKPVKENINNLKYNLHTLETGLINLDNTLKHLSKL